ncbi:Protein of unknown function [Gryllus bimaculatus]|nr:Protein of unknown function [Gryllus bimaculatus]
MEWDDQIRFGWRNRPKSPSSDCEDVPEEKRVIYNFGQRFASTGLWPLRFPKKSLMADMQQRIPNKKKEYFNGIVC